MRNTLAIARRELHSYFASPIAYMLVGLFALLILRRDRGQGVAI